MAKMKIYEIARSLQSKNKEIKSGDLVKLLNDNGFEVKGANSNIEDDAIAFLLKTFSNTNKSAVPAKKKETESKAAEPPAPKKEVPEKRAEQPEDVKKEKKEASEKADPSVTGQAPERKETDRKEPRNQESQNKASQNGEQKNQANRGQGGGDRRNQGNRNQNGGQGSGNSGSGSYGNGDRRNQNNSGDRRGQNNNGDRRNGGNRNQNGGQGASGNDRRGQGNRGQGNGNFGGGRGQNNNGDRRNQGNRNQNGGGQKNIEASAFFQLPAQLSNPALHLLLRILIRSRFVADTAAEPKDTDPIVIINLILHADTAAGTPLSMRAVMISVDMQNIRPRIHAQIFQIVRFEIARREYQVNAAQIVPVEVIPESL